VEINRSFYRLPTPDNFRRWAWQASFHHGFQFAVKASRYITHVRKLYGPEEPLGRLDYVSSGLGLHRGPILYQMPPNFEADYTRLAYFISRLPWHTRAAFEFRHHSWFRDDILRLLDESGCTLVRAIGGHYTPLEVPDVGPFRYLRFHGGLYGVGFTDGELGFWADRIAGDAWAGREVYAYFNNDPDCHAVYDAWRLMSMVAHTGALAP
jgi:uncharacterized protein YecE (DUF72 family)